MLRPILAAALLMTALPLSAATFQATPAAQPAAARIIVRDTAWRCGDAGCVATTASSRPAVVCAALVKKVGRLDAFSVNGTRFSAAQLESCNAKAR